MTASECIKLSRSPSPQVWSWALSMANFIWKFPFSSVSTKTVPCPNRIGYLRAIFLKGRFLSKVMENLCICLCRTPSGAVSNCPLGTQFNSLKICVKRSPLNLGKPLTLGVPFITLPRCPMSVYFTHIFIGDQVAFGHLRIPLPFAQVKLWLPPHKQAARVGRKAAGMERSVRSPSCAKAHINNYHHAQSDKLFPSCKTNWLPFGDFKKCDPLPHVS